MGCCGVTTSFYTLADFVIPVCDLSVVITIPGDSPVMVGAYLWSPGVGSYYINSFDPVTREVSLINQCSTNGNAPTGTIVPACTPFLLIPVALA